MLLAGVASPPLTCQPTGRIWTVYAITSITLATVATTGVVAVAAAATGHARLLLLVCASGAAQLL